MWYVVSVLLVHEYVDVVILLFSHFGDHYKREVGNAPEEIIN